MIISDQAPIRASLRLSTPFARPVKNAQARLSRALWQNRRVGVASRIAMTDHLPPVQPSEQPSEQPSVQPSVQHAPALPSQTLPGAASAASPGGLPVGAPDRVPAYAGPAGRDPSADLVAAPHEGEAALADALARLDAAIASLAGRLAAAQRDAKAADNLRIEHDRLSAALEASHQRERDLQRAAQEASQALDQAIAEVRAVLGEP
jgi:hypothetical protein